MKKQKYKIYILGIFLIFIGLYLSIPNGKLRLNCELNPLAFIAEQAGGMATDGKNRILEIEPRELHQRCPAVIGSKNEVLLFGEYGENKK